MRHWPGAGFEIAEIRPPRAVRDLLRTARSDQRDFDLTVGDREVGASPTVEIAEEQSISGAVA